MMDESAKKIVSYGEGTSLAYALSSGGFKLVLTTGCFDCFNIGHCRFLEAARSAGEHLMVGVYADWIVEALGGRGRPFYPLAERMEIVAAMGCVSSVVPVEERTASGIIGDNHPAVWVKGGNYTIDTLDRAELAAARCAGADIKIIPVSAAPKWTRT